MIRYSLYETEFGTGAVASSEEGISRVVLPQSTEDAAGGRILSHIPSAKLVDEDDGGEVLRLYFSGRYDIGPVALDLSDCSEFEKQVYEVTQAIPAGETRTYRWIAACVGRPGAERAVGGALGRNPVPVLVPCHRVIRSDGSLGGWSGDRGWKERLLNHEAKTA